MDLQTNHYYEEFLRYHEMAKWQHEHCNLGLTPHKDTPFDDDLIKNVYLYDVVERKYAGFNQLMLDLWYDFKDHPYRKKMSKWRKELVQGVDTSFWSLPEWLFVFFVHRLTGSGINYAKIPAGYHNSIFLDFKDLDTIEDMCDFIRGYTKRMFTSIGYHIAPFPKPEEGYKQGGKYFICEHLPRLVRMFADYLEEGDKKQFRCMMDFISMFNKECKFKVFWFQYAATLSDVADFFPEYVQTESHFFSGKNAIEGLEYMAKKPYGLSRTVFHDLLMNRIMEDTGSVPYNAEDIVCDWIRWLESYINPKADYGHLDMDKIFSSHRIEDHPYGRQKMMLKLGIVDTFNGKPHPSDDKILREANLTVEQYKDIIWDDQL